MGWIQMDNHLSSGTPVFATFHLIKKFVNELTHDFLVFSPP